MLAHRRPLPAAYCDELFGLSEQGRAVPLHGRPADCPRGAGAAAEEVFASFEHASFAAASIGQVHRATLHNGDHVAVKVQRPRIRQKLQADIDLMYGTSWLLDRVHLSGSVAAAT